MAKDEDYLDGLLEKLMNDSVPADRKGASHKFGKNPTIEDSFFDDLDEFDDDFLDGDDSELLRKFEEELGLMDYELPEFGDGSSEMRQEIDEMLDDVSRVVNAEPPEDVAEVILEPDADASDSEKDFAEFATVSKTIDMDADSADAATSSEIEQLIKAADEAAEQHNLSSEQHIIADEQPAEDQIHIADIPDESSAISSSVDNTSKKHRKGIPAALANLIFGKNAPEDEEEIARRAAEQAGISLSEQTALMDEQSRKTEDEKSARKAAKKAAAETKKKAKQDAAAAKKKEKAAKKAAKPAKPKKEKKSKDPNARPVNKRPIIVVAVFTASVFIFVNLLSSAATYSADISKATSLYNAGQYVSAYRELAGQNAHESDQNFYEGTKMLAILQQAISRHDTDASAGRSAEALDILIRAVGSYKTNYDKADDLGIMSQYSALGNQIETLLSDNYGVSYDRALELYNMNSRDDYTVEILKILDELGKGEAES